MMLYISCVGGGSISPSLQRSSIFLKTRRAGVGVVVAALPLPSLLPSSSFVLYLLFPIR